MDLKSIGKGLFFVKRIWEKERAGKTGNMGGYGVENTEKTGWESPSGDLYFTTV
ncbi:MAG: hypothetical protein IJ865_06600 [Clostridia bacterium]|nr:hypothetical protein [Clostridia bacterium]